MYVLIHSSQSRHIRACVLLLHLASRFALLYNSVWRSLKSSYIISWCQAGQLPYASDMGGNDIHNLQWRYCTTMTKHCCIMCQLMYIQDILQANNILCTFQHTFTIHTTMAHTYSFSCSLLSEEFVWHPKIGEMNVIIYTNCTWGILWDLFTCYTTYLVSHYQAIIVVKLREQVLRIRTSILMS